MKSTIKQRKKHLELVFYVQQGGLMPFAGLSTFNSIFTVGVSDYTEQDPNLHILQRLPSRHNENTETSKQELLT